MRVEPLGLVRPDIGQESQPVVGVGGIEWIAVATQPGNDPQRLIERREVAGPGRRDRQRRARVPPGAGAAKIEMDTGEP